MTVVPREHHQITILAPGPQTDHTCRLTTFTTDRHPLNGLFSRTTSVSWHQKGQTILDFNEAKYDGVTVASAGPYANHLHLTPDR